MTPPMTIGISFRPRRSSALRRAGTRVRWPAAKELGPTTSTSFSTASLAAASGVWNNGPNTTSKPRSENAAPTTSCPRSCPSCPSLQIKMRLAARLLFELGHFLLDRQDRLFLFSKGFEVHPRNQLLFVLVSTEHLVQGVTDLTHGRFCPRRLD